MLTTLEAVPLQERIRGVLTALKAEPGLSGDERAELLCVALWPSSDRFPVCGVPLGLADRDAARIRAGELRVAGWSFADVAREVGVPAATLKSWARQGRLEPSSRATPAPPNHSTDAPSRTFTD